MREAAAAATERPWWSATVIKHEKVTRDVAIVKARPDQPVPYRAGNYVSVEIPQRPGCGATSRRPTHRARTATSNSTYARSKVAGSAERSSTTLTKATSGAWGGALGALAVHPTEDRKLLLIGSAAAPGSRR
jgi:NAD(P)H-flavin reductase